MSESTFMKATMNINAAQRRAITKARQAGVPLITILTWLVTYGPKIEQMIQELLDRWKKK